MLGEINGILRECSVRVFGNQRVKLRELNRTIIEEECRVHRTLFLVEDGVYAQLSVIALQIVRSLVVIHLDVESVYSSSVRCRSVGIDVDSRESLEVGIHLLREFQPVSPVYQLPCEVVREIKGEGGLSVDDWRTLHHAFALMLYQPGPVVSVYELLVIYSAFEFVNVDSLQDALVPFDGNRSGIEGCRHGEVINLLNLTEIKRVIERH